MLGDEAAFVRQHLRMDVFPSSAKMTERRIKHETMLAVKTSCLQQNIILSEQSL